MFILPEMYGMFLYFVASNEKTELVEFFHLFLCNLKMLSPKQTI